MVSAMGGRRRLRRMMIIAALAPTLLSAAEPQTFRRQFLFVSTWTNTSSITTFTLDERGVLSRVGATSAGGRSIEDLLVVDRGSHRPFLLAASNPCNFRDPVSKHCLDQHRDPRICSVSSLELDDIARPRLARISMTWSGGLGPTALAMHPSSAMVAVANYQSGIASFVPFTPHGVLLSTMLSTNLLNATSSLAHDVAFDERCGRAANLLLVDAGALKMATFDTHNARLERASSTGVRPRHVVIHAEQDVLYVLYELDGSVGIWPWEGHRGIDQVDACGRLGHAELSRVPSAPRKELCANSSALSEWEPTCLNDLGESIVRPFPTELVLSHDSRYLYVSNARNSTGSSVAGNLVVYATGNRTLRMLQAYEPPLGARSIGLSACGRFLLTVDPDTGGLTSLRLCPLTGRILGVASQKSGLPLASSVVAWRPSPFNVVVV